jgi:hypothetical protein
MGTLVYNVKDTATQVVAARRVKENIYLDLVHRNGYGVTQVDETNASTVRMLKVSPFTGDARELGAVTNGGFFNSDKASIPTVPEYDLNLLYIYDKMVDLPEVQQDITPVKIFEQAMKNVGGRVSTEINASTFAHQLKAKFDLADTAGAWDGLAVVLGSTPDYYGAILDASTILDNGDEDNGIQAFPFAEREIVFRPTFRKGLLSAQGVLIGGSNYAQSMIAKGAVSPEDRKEWGNMYCGEIDMIPCYIVPAPIWNRAKVWAGNSATVDGVQAIVMSALATDRGISTQDYVKVIDSPDGAGFRLQPKTRWGINVCYPKGIVPILANGTAVPTAATTITAPGNVSVGG